MAKLPDDAVLAQLEREMAHLKKERKRYDTMIPVDPGTYSSASREHALLVSDELIAAKQAEIDARKAQLGIS